MCSEIVSEYHPPTLCLQVEIHPPVQSIWRESGYARLIRQPGVPGDQNTISMPFVGGHVRSRDMENECKQLSASYMHGSLWYFKYSEINCIC